MSLGQASTGVLFDAGLILPTGRREVPEHPTLLATTPRFLAQFGLRSLGNRPLPGQGRRGTCSGHGGWLVRRLPRPCFGLTGPEFARSGLFYLER